MLFAGLVYGGGESLPFSFILKLGIGLLVLAALRSSPVTLRLPDPLDLLAACFLVYSLVSFAWSIYPWAAIQHAMNLSAVVLFYYLLRRQGFGLAEGGRDNDFAWYAVGIAAAVSAAFAGYQAVVHHIPRPGGFYVNANFLADLLIMGCVVSLGLAGRAPAGAFWRKSVWIAIALLTACVLPLTRSRSMLPMAAAVAIFLLIAWRGKRVLTGLLSLLLILPVGASLLSRFSTEADPFSMSRLLIWKAAWKSAIEHPFGVGLGGYPFSWLLYRDPLPGAIFRFGKTADTAHSLLFGTLAEFGFPGVIMLGGMCVAMAVLIARETRRPGRFLPLCCIPVAVAVHAIFDVGMTLPGLALPVAACAAALVNRNERGPAGRIDLSVTVRCVLAFPVILAVAYAGTSAWAVLDANRGMRAIQENRLEVAREAYTRANRLDPLCSAYPDALASIDYRLYLRTRKEPFLSSALQFEQDARVLSPANSFHMSQVGLLLQMHAEVAGNPQDAALFFSCALAALNRSLARNPDSVDTLHRMALIHEKMGDRDEARRILERAVALEPNDVHGMLALADLVESADPAGARALYARALSVRAELGGKALEPYERTAIAFDEEGVRRRMNDLAEHGRNREGKSGRADGMIDPKNVLGSK